MAEELGIRCELLRKMEHDQCKECSFLGHDNPNMTNEEKEIIRLKKELKELNWSVIL
ncbi:hypothetical protein [Fulvivirga marina]|uniref:hypothetical protein n=1 Tax=Fulvivirga marina TaxID=2494733 RepID=UPI001EE2628D|nr:hypothetical protein [Fulvivirga marina]